MAISVASAIANNASGVDSVTVNSGAAESEFVLGWASYNDNTATPWSGGDFDTKLTEKDDATGEDTSIAVFHEIAPASPPSSYTFDGSDGSPTGTSRVGGIVISFLGVDAASPFDVTYVEGSHYTKQVNDTTPTPQPITTATNGAMVVIFVFTNNNTITDFGDIAGYTKEVETLGNDRNVAVFTKVVATAGVETPAALAPTGIGSGDDSVMVTLAIKPGATSSISIDSVGVDELNNVVDNEIQVAIRNAGGGFNALQGTGTVALADTDPVTTTPGTSVSQSITSWSDTEIVITVDQGALTAGNVWMHVTEDGGDEASKEITLIADDPGNPVIRSQQTNVTLASGVPISLDLGATFFHSTAQDQLTYTVSGEPDAFSINPTSGLYSGAVDQGQSAGSPYTVTVTATDRDGNSVNDVFTHTIGDEPVNYPTDGPFSSADDYLHWRRRMLRMRGRLVDVIDQELKVDKKD